MGCKVCGRDFEQYHRGMCGRCYVHWMRWNAPPNAKCQQCGRAFYARRDGERVCGRDCYAQWKRGRDSHNKVISDPVQETYTCEYCGESFEAYAHQRRKGFAKFCGYACFSNSRRVPRDVIDCEGCGEPIQTWRRGGTSVKTFCSRACMVECRRRRKVAREGARPKEYEALRRKLLAEQPWCADCGATKNLLVHHKIRSRERPDLLMDLNNLVVLCKGCHTAVHARAGHMFGRTNHGQM